MALPIEREKIRRGLLAKGFVEVTKKKDHDFYYLHVEGRKTSVFTRLSRGTDSKDYSDALVSKVHRQIGLTKQEFLTYLDCSLTLDNYLGRLHQQKRIK